MQKDNSQLSFSTLSVSKRKVKSVFFEQINLLLDWGGIELEIKKYYTKGLSVGGRPSYSGLLLFKMSLLQTWYGLSDYEVEEKVNDSLSFMQFVGLRLEDPVPDNSVLSRFRTALTKQGAYEKLMGTINAQLESKAIVVKKGAIVDASITDTARKPRGKKEYQVVEDRKESDTVADTTVADTTEPTKTALVVKVQPQVDKEASWVKKAGKLRYGYKKHIATDEQGLVIALITTPANESDTVHFEALVKKAGLQKGCRVRADKGYSSQGNRNYLKSQKLKDGIMHKALRNKPLSPHQQTFNKLVSKTRFKVERTFAGITRWFKTGIARYVGTQKTHTQHVLEAIAYNLYRAPAIQMANEIRMAK